MSIFTKIIQRELPAEIVYENSDLIVIKDIVPQAPVHLLIIPKVEIENLQSVKTPDIMGKVLLAVQHLAKEFKIEKGYRLVVNNGKGAGQTVSHLHFHLLGGAELSHNFK